MFNKKRKKFNGSNEMIAKLSFDEGFREERIYKIIAKTSEKQKGIEMIELLEYNFKISEGDRKNAFNIKMKELNRDSNIPTIAPKGFKQEKIKFTRDDKGNLASPFRTKKKIG